MNSENLYFPAIVCSEHEAALDALVALAVPRDEAMDLVVATWAGADRAILTTISGGRPVVAVPVAAGRWVACNAFPLQGSASPSEAGRNLARLLKRGRRGLVACIAAAEGSEAGEGGCRIQSRWHEKANA